MQVACRLTAEICQLTAWVQNSGLLSRRSARAILDQDRLSQRLNALSHVPAHSNGKNYPPELVNGVLQAELPPFVSTILQDVSR